MLKTAGKLHMKHETPHSWSFNPLIPSPSPNTPCWGDWLRDSLGALGTGSQQNRLSQHETKLHHYRTGLRKIHPGSIMKI
jgi:hypothetical protein